MPLGLLGKKLGSARVYNASGALIPVTVVLAGPNRVLQVKSQAGKDGYNAVQLGFGDQKPQRIAKPRLGHLVKFGALDKAAADKARDKGDKTALVGVMPLRPSVAANARRSGSGWRPGPLGAARPPSTSR